jgi:UDP-GlcNAc3NAcA epimerase
VRILTVVGNRPQFIKAAAVSGPLREFHEEILVHTGQHYDDSLSRVFFNELGLARPDREPEELNRVLSDAADNLRAESVAGTIEVVGDVMVDVALRWQPAARANADVPAAYGLSPGNYLLLTAHRAGNVDDPERLRALVELVLELPHPVLFPLHPRTRARLIDAGLLDTLERRDGVQLTAPLGYVEFSALVCQARAVLTDSGGVQKEAYLAGVPCVTLRANTEWVETVETGWNTLVDLDADAALGALERDPPAERPTLYGDGHAAERCVEAIGRL